ncbi:MAG: hypothetical protein MK135_12435, partial [Polyangiaceae bacterium]|nr:hypothetical protein [Polyangiaceae bacterium]
MSHSLPPRSERNSQAPDLPSPLQAALEKARIERIDWEAWEVLDETCRELDRPEEAAALYCEVLDPVDESKHLNATDLEELGRRAADFCEEWFDDPEPVVEVLTTVLKLDASQSWAFERLTVLLTVSSRFSDLLQVYDSALDAVASDDIDRKVALLEEAAKVARDFAGQPQKGTDYLRLLLEVRPRDDQLAATVEKRLLEEARHEQLIHVWTARLEVLSGENLQQARLSIAGANLQYRSDSGQALAVLEEYLKEAADPAPSIDLIEEMSVADHTPEEIRVRSLRHLEDLYGRLERFEPLVLVLRRLLNFVVAGDEADLVHEKVAALLCQLEREVDALPHLGELLLRRAQDEKLRSRVRDIATRHEKLDLYQGYLVQAARALAVGEGESLSPERLELQVDLFLEAARQAEAELGDRTQALELFSLVLSSESADESARLYAAQELSRLYRSDSSSLALLEILEQRVPLEEKDEQRAAVIREAAHLATELGQKERALQLW